MTKRVDARGEAAKQPGFWDAWKEAPYSIRYAKPYKKTWFGAVGLTLISAGLAVLAPWPLAFLIDTVLQDKKAIPEPIVRLVGTSVVALIAFAAVATLLITVMLQGVALLYEYMTTKMDQHMTLDLRSDLFEHAQRLSLAYHDQAKTGKFIYTVNSMATSAGNITMAVPPIAQALFTLIGMFWVTYRIDPVIALISITIIPPVYYALGRYNRRVLPAVREVAGREMEALSVVHEALTMLRTVVAFGREPYEHGRYRTQARHVVDARVEVTVRQTLFSFAVETLTAVGTALVMAFGAYQVVLGHMTVGSLTVVLAYVAAIYSPVQQISGTLGHLQIDLYHLHRCKSLLQTDPEVKEKPDPVLVDRARGHIRYEHVMFAYQGRASTLVDVDFDIPEGQRVAVLGPTGAGKTTLVSLLLRYHDPREGRILLDGQDIRTLSLKSLRNQIAIVHQEPVLFSGTIADNIRYGRLDASLRDIVAAAKAASAHEFIMRLPKQYETQLGERGAQLSGGERQRISIARAFVRDAPILVLDEPTSSIDAKTEVLILDALERLMKGRTTILIAHRLSTIRTAQQILVLNEGKLVERGRHEELIAIGGLYSQLWTAQLGSMPHATESAGQTEAAGVRIANLARALSAASEADRGAAREELATTDREELIEWARQALRSGSLEEAMNGARLAETLGLADVAVDIIERAATLQGNDGGALISAFRSFPFDPRNVETILTAIRPGQRARAVDFLLGALGAEVAPELQRLIEKGSPPISEVVSDALQRADETGDSSDVPKTAQSDDVPSAAPHRDEPAPHPVQVTAHQGPLLTKRPRIVVFGMITKMPVAGVIWQTVHYLIGLRHLGYAVTYVEAHGRTPTMFMDQADDDGWGRAAGVLAGVMDRFGFAKDWAYQAHDADRQFGLSEGELRNRISSADLLINLHGGMLPLSSHVETGRLIYLETDPVEVQVQLAEGRADTVSYLEAHAVHFSFGENIGEPDCSVPVSDRFTFLPTRQPVVMELWKRAATRPGIALTTVGNWEQAWRQVRFGGEVYTWSKHHEFLKFIDLPSKTLQPLELALSSSSIKCEQRDVLERKGWRYRDALEFSRDLDEYRDYVRSSRGEFTVAKDQNVRLRSGWFSDRSATYLAAGRPVITQETGFSNILPTGEGLFAFTTMDDIVESVNAMNSDYERHAAAALEIGRQFFAHDVVLPRLLDACGVGPAQRSPSTPARPDSGPIPDDLILEPVSRRPLRLADSTERRIDALSIARTSSRVDAPTDVASLTSIIVVSYNALPLTKLCLASLLTSTDAPYEVVVVDNGSTDGSRPYLRELAAGHPQVRIVENEGNKGFAAAVNQGAVNVRGDTLVILNNDTVLASGWLPILRDHLADARIGLVGAVTNRSGTGAEVPVTYRTYGEFVREAASRAQHQAGRRFDIDTAAMFCAALRRTDYQRIGPLDESYGLGLFEDTDYSMRVRADGHRVVCAEDVLIHHFGEGSFGKLVPTGEHAGIFERNRRRFEERWGPWSGHERQPDPDYETLVRRIRDIVDASVPLDATVLVVSRGDDSLLDLSGRTAWHFPQSDGEAYAGHYPATDEQAIAQLDELRRRGAAFLVVPATGAWWLTYYTEFASYVTKGCVIDVPGTCSIYALSEPRESPMESVRLSGIGGA